MNELVNMLQELGPGAVVTTVAVYPRATSTGLADELGRTLQALANKFECIGGAVHRVLYSQIVVVFSAEVDTATVSQSCEGESSARVEVRATSTRVDGPRDQRWLDCLVGDLSVRRNFGSFRNDPAVRWSDDGTTSSDDS